MQLPHWLILAGCLLVLGGVLGLLLTQKPRAIERSAPGLFDGDHDGDQREIIYSAPAAITARERDDANAGRTSKMG